jgi:hypothetical protein
MTPITMEVLTEQLQLADQLHSGRENMFEPQDLPGRYGRVVKSLDHVLLAIQCPAVVGGGWAVWRHGYLGRVTQGIDIVLPADKVDQFLQAASLSGFEILEVPAGRWPKTIHRETDILVDLLPEGERPGTPSHPAPTTIPHPTEMGALGTALKYIQLASLIELKLAASRSQDEADVIKLIQANPAEADKIRRHLAQVHQDYLAQFEQLAQRARDEAID